MGRRRLVRVDTTVSTVSTAAHLRSLVDLDVGNNEGRGIKSLCLCVGLSVLEEVKEVVGALLGPANRGSLVLLSLTSTTTAVAVANERNDILVSDDLVKVLLSLLEVHTCDSGSGLTGVL